MKRKKKKEDQPFAACRLFILFLEWEVSERYENQLFSRARLEKQEEMELKIKSLTEEVQELRGLVNFMISNSNAQRTPTTDKFGLEDAHKDHCLSLINVVWRRYKSKITNEIRNVASGPTALRSIKILEPNNVGNDEEWENFVNTRRSAQFDEISESMSQLAKRNSTTYTTSRKGLARLREDLIKAKEVASEDHADVDWAAMRIAGHKHKDETPVNEKVAQDQVQNTMSSEERTSVANDAISQVLGKEHRGCVPGLGSEATPSKVHAAVVGRPSTTEMQIMIKDLQKQVMGLKSIVMTNMAIDKATNVGVQSDEQSQGTQKYSSASNIQGTSRGLKRIIPSTSKSCLNNHHILR